MKSRRPISISGCRCRIEPLEARIAPAFTVTIGVASPTVSFVSDSVDDALVLAVDGDGYLAHNLFPGDGRYESAIDLDPAPGIQKLSAAAILDLGIVLDIQGNHDVTLGTEVNSWSWGVSNTHISSSGGGIASGRLSLTINDSTATLDGVVKFAAGEVSDDLNGSGKVAFQDLHFLKYQGGSGDDEFDVEAASTELKIDGGAGNDAYHLKYSKIEFPVRLSDSSGTEDDVEIEGTSGPDDITIDEGGVSHGLELISFSPASGIEKLTVEGGAGADTLIVGKLPAGNAEVLGQAGEDKIIFKSQVSATVDGGEDGDTYFLKFSQDDSDATVKIHDTGSAGFDDLKLDGSALDDLIDVHKGEIRYHKADLPKISGLFIKFDGIESETLGGGSGADTFVIKGSTGDLRLDGGTGNDSYTIKFDGSPQHITLAPSSADGGAPDADLLHVLGTDAADRFTLHPGELNLGSEAYLKFEGVIADCVSGLKLDSGAGNDRIYVDAHDASAVDRPPVLLEFFGGAGNDNVTLVSAPGAFTVDGGAGSDTVAVQFSKLNVGGTLTDSGRTGTDRIFVLGTAENERFTVDATGPTAIAVALDQSSAAIQFLKYEIFTLDAGAGDDEAIYHTIKMGNGSARFLGGLGDDRVTLTGDHEVGSLKLDGGEGADEYIWEAGGSIKGAVQIEDSGSGADGGDDSGDVFTVLGTDDGDTMLVGRGVAIVHDARVAFGRIEFLKIDGKAGDDVITVRGGSNDCDDLEILGGAGNDRITNTIKLAPEPLNAYAGLLLPAVQKITVADAGPGGGPHVRIFGGSEDDSIIGGAGNEFIDGGAGNDVIKAGGGNDRITGGLGDDVVSGGGGNDTVVESEDADFFFSKTELKGAGSDRVAGIEAFEITGGDRGNTFDFSGFDGKVFIHGGAGNDVFLGGRGNDVFSGGLGDDKFDGGAGRNEVAEQGDVDFTVTGDGKASRLIGLGDDTLTNIALITLEGGDSANSLDGTKWKGDLILSGGGGDDTLLGGAGSNVFRGGDGDDTIVGRGAMNLLLEIGDVDFTLGATLLVGRGVDTFSGINSAVLIGGDSDNLLDASKFQGSILLAGLGGDDHLIGGLGMSVLLGGDGDDVLMGSAKLTRFVGGPGSNTIIKT